ncbi:hypothetical protein BK711_04725 [Bacillus thuringiensis serovar fukuokaensis]|nr:hypothetical protein BK711_04725 [Bacillus thuringiensis serovar fukuokaensis]
MIADKAGVCQLFYNYITIGEKGTSYENNEGDALFINSNYAIDAKLNPTKDAIAIEGSDSPYANIIAVRKGDEKKKEIKELVEVLHSKEIQDFINKEYKGAVLPISE